MSDLEARLAGTPYESYLYAYPHKTAYRPLAPTISIRDAWTNERRDALFLYFHVPFCEMRCGFCNLFTTVRPKEDAVEAFLGALERQCRVVARALPDATYARFAIGGGTPTLLETRELERVFDLAERVMGAKVKAIPASVETSPETATRDRLQLLRDRGVNRVSIGVQSFVEAESAAVKRPQKDADVRHAIDTMTDIGFPTVNIDLMYGLPGQTPATWKHSLDTALGWRPAEIYLYPLYVRPLTTLGRHPRQWDDERLAFYRQARETLLGAGYTQSSMRMFRRADAPADDGPVYCIQDDGMVGLGCGARSYTTSLHYASEYAVGARGVRDIIAAWVDKTDDAFACADYGFALDGDEQRRRFVAMSLLVADGLDLAAYRARFGSEALADLPLLEELAPRGLASVSDRRLALTPAGIERSDNLGPWLYSPDVVVKMASCDLR